MTINLGDTVPDFNLTTLDGSQTEINSFRGKPLIIFMWASW